MPYGNILQVKKSKAERTPATPSPIPIYAVTSFLPSPSNACTPPPCPALHHHDP